MFWIDEQRGRFKTYQDMVADINCLNSIGENVFSSDPYEVQIQLIQSILLGRKIALVDSDLSPTELMNLGIESTDLEKRSPISLQIRTLDELFMRIEERRHDWRLELFTSGTTGLPKRIEHSFDNLTRNVRSSELRKNDVWAYAYNPTHIAGIQVFFQAFLNRNPMVYIFGYESMKIMDLLHKYSVSHISATPTFYRTVFSKNNSQVDSIVSLTMGGERFDSGLRTVLLKLFPNANMKNVYASTEGGTLFNSNDDVFTIPESLRTKVCISDDSELVIHSTLLGKAEKLSLVDEWYFTGDIVEKVGENKIRFVSRKSEMVNIGGYKVHPSEVEDVLQKISGVHDAVVRVRQNRVTGNILVADIISDKSCEDEEIKRNIFRSLPSYLQHWKIPQIIKIVEKIEHTRTGKKVRK